MAGMFVLYFLVYLHYLYRYNLRSFKYGMLAYLVQTFASQIINIKNNITSDINEGDESYIASNKLIRNEK